MREEDVSLARGSWVPWSLLVPIALWLVMTLLRESALFWRNAGGYPVELRAFVLLTYYPASAMILLGCGLGALHAFSRAAVMRRSTVIGWLVVAATVGGGLAYAGANNLSNLMDGRPVHYHPEPR